MRTILKRSAAFIVCVCLLLSAISINVFAASSSVAFSKSTLTLGETLTVTARFSSSSSMYGLWGYVTYDPKVIEFVSGDNCKFVGDGQVKVVLAVPGKVNVTETLKFKPIAAGKSAITLEQLVYSDGNSEQTMTGASANITVTNPSVAASSNANLRSLGISAGTLTPEFSPDVTSYSVIIPYSETELWVQPGLDHKKATYVVNGSKAMKVGVNRRVVVVTAENGKSKSYTINITRLDKEGQVPGTNIEEPVNDMVEVIAEGETYYVNENFSDKEIPAGFEIIDYAINGKTVPALSDNEIILVCLIKPDGTDSDFFIKNSDESFTRLAGLEIGGKAYYILPASHIPEGYSETLITVNEKEYKAYDSSNPDEKEFVLIYAKGPSKYTGFYRYDTVEGTIQRAPVGFSIVPDVNDNEENEATGNIIENFYKLNTKGKIFALTIVAVLLLLIITIVVLIIKLICAIVNSVRERKFRHLEEIDEEQIGFDYVNISHGEQTKDTLVIEESADEDREEPAEEPIGED